MRTFLAVLTILSALPSVALAAMDDPATAKPRPDKIQFLCTSEVQRQCLARLGACAGTAGSTPTSCCAEWTMCLNTYHCNEAGLHCRRE